MSDCKKAVEYVMQRIASDPNLYYEMDEFTESFALLAAAFAEIHGVTVEEVRRQFVAPKGEARIVKLRRELEER